MTLVGLLAGRSWFRVASWYVGAVIVASGVTYEVIKRNFGPTQAVKLLILTAALAFAVWALERPYVAVYGALTAAAFEQQVTVLGFRTGTAEVALIVFAPPMVMLWRRQALSLGLRLAFIALPVGALLSMYTAHNASQALWGTVRWALVLNFVAATISLLWAEGEGGFRRLALWIANLGTVVGMFALLQRSGRFVIVGAPYQFAHPDSTFGYYTVYANFMAVATVVAVGLFLISVKKRDSAAVIMASSSVAVGVYCIMFALSRGALLTLGAGLAFLMLVRGRKPQAFIGGIFALAVAGVATFALTSPETIQLLARRFQDSSSSDTIRESLHAAGRTLLDKHPLGIGYNNFEGLLANGLVSADQPLAHAHNLYIQMGLDAGWLGLVAFVVIVSTALLRAIRSGLRSGGYAYPATFGAALAGYLANGPFDYLLYETGSMIVLAALIAGALVIQVSRTRPNRPISRERFRHPRLHPAPAP